MNPFYVSDSATVNLNDPSGVQMLYPGAANQSGIIPASTAVSIFITSCSFVVVPNVTVSSNLQINTDMFVGLYNSSGVFQGRTPFVAPYGTAANGLILNQCASLNPGLQTLTPRAWRHFAGSDKLTLGQTSSSSSTYQVGAGFQFNFSSPVLINYEYHLHGKWV